MRDNECVAFLQWALPSLRMRWPGFRKVRSQVCKRIQRRIEALGLASAADYRDYLEQHNSEWRTLDTLCRVSISRFYRDKQVFALLEQKVMPALAQQAIARGEKCLTAWSAGCGSGEEPYSVELLWQLRLQARFPGLALRILASDADPVLIRRAENAVYQYATIKNLPPEWREEGFNRDGEDFHLKPAYRQAVRFIVQDVRREIPNARFDLVLCRNLVFTYYEESQQREWLEKIKGVLMKGGVLVLGVHETLPEGVAGFAPWSKRLCTFRKIE